MIDQIFAGIEFCRQNTKGIVVTVFFGLTILVLFFGLPNEVLYAKRGILRWLPFMIIFGFTPWMLSKTLKVFRIREDYILLISFGSILILGPLFGVWMEIQANKDLKKNGKIIEGIIYRKWLSEGYTGDEWLLKCYFYHEKKKYSTFTEEDEFNQFQVGDTLMIQFSTNTPENNMIIGLDKEK